MEIPVRMRQTRIRQLNRESPSGFKCQVRSTSWLAWEPQPMLEILNTWSFEALAIVVVFALVASGVIRLMQGRRR
jgi:hypothetical protein